MKSLRVVLLVSVALVCLQSLPAAAAAEGSFPRPLQVTGAVNVELTTGSGSVHVRTGSSNQVQITGHIKATSWFSDAERRVKEIEDNPPIQQNGNDIRIGQNHDSELFHNISISYELVVPQQTGLRSHTGSGSQDVDGLQGQVQIQSGSGGLRIANIGDRVSAETGSGDIQIEQVHGNVRAKAGSGSIHATDISGGFEGGTGSGHIVFAQSGTGAVRAETGSGGM